MFSIVAMEERSFTEMQELRDFIASQDRQEYEVPISKISLSENGILQAGGFEGQLAGPALTGLLNTEGIPPRFALEHCPKDLLVTMVQRLASEQSASVRIQSINGIATAIMPANRQPIRHDMVIDRLHIKHPIKEAILGVGHLRLIGVTEASVEVLPSDAFSSGWELITSEDGWHPTEAWRFVMRQICSNGMMGFDKKPIFSRAYNSREPVLRSLDGLVHVIENAIKPPELKPAIKWAAENQLANEYQSVVDYLARTLEGEATKQALNDITPSASWYQLLNSVTSLARLHSLEMRRRYEEQGGMLLNWALREGRGRPSWRKASCEECDVWNVSPAVETN